jgi:signal transduction histidine kinase
MGDENRSRRLQRSIIISSALGILVVGVIVGLTSMFPLYRHVKKVQESHLMWIVATKTSAIEEILSRATETGANIAALPEVTELLNDPMKAGIDPEGLAKSIQATLSTTGSYLPTVRGVSIFDDKGNPVAQIGHEFPGLASSLAESRRKPIFFGSTASASFDCLAVAVPLHDEAVAKTGAAVVTFRISDFERVVKDHTGLGSTGETVFGTIEHNQFVAILQSRKNRRPTWQSLPNESPFALAIQRAALNQTGVLIPGTDHTGTAVIAYGPVGAGQWGMAVKMDKSELYAHMFPHITTTGSMIAALVMLGILGTILLIRPLTGKMVIHADELQRQVQEKVKIIDNLYEHIVQSEKSKAIAQHTAEVAHELRQPLAIIGGFARRMAKHFDSQGTWGAEQQESCRIIIAEIQRLEKILGSLIDFTGKRSLRLERVNPNRLVQNVINVYEGKIMEKALRLETSLASDVGEVVLDADRFEQVVRNLLSNAMEASPAGQSIRIQARVYDPSPKARQTGELESEQYFEMTVHNHGPAIPPEHLHRIFSPFFTTKDGGNGLGLTVTKKIVEDHNGSISVQSDEEGTVFTVWLPVERELSEST